jgi:tetratricopeptide (TPR) repeat protein
MSRTLTLIEAGWDCARTLAARGRKADALAQLTRLLARPDVPAALTAEAHRLAGDLALGLEKFATARRHLNAAAALEPNHAGTRYAMGRAWEEDPDGCDRRAAICFQKAAALDGTNPAYRVAFGRAASRCGKLKLGAREMLAAVDAAGCEIGVVRAAVSGLLEVGKVGAARRVVAKARFLRPGDAELAAMWGWVKFETARLAQRTTQGKTRYAQDAQFATDGDRVTLPFLRIAETGECEGTGGTVRRDTASFPRPHVARLHARKAD